MNSYGNRLNDNARCENMWAFIEDELFILAKSKIHTISCEKFGIIAWRYFT